jgi:hypothetical protein
MRWLWRRAYGSCPFHWQSRDVTPTRILCWFSCGIPSAVAAWVEIEENKRREVPLPIEVCRIIVRNEHPDNDRYTEDCEAWLGVKIKRLIADKYDGDIYNVFNRERYIAGPRGAACTGRLKKAVREAYQQPGDLHVFGFYAEEADRLLDMQEDGLLLSDTLIRRGMTQADCHGLFAKTGIRPPYMYELGYQNNNCVGCVKGGKGYWNKIRVDFPWAFDRMARKTRELGVKLIKDSKKVDGKPVTIRRYLDELRPDEGHYPTEVAIECGIACEAAEREMVKDEPCEV